MKLWPRLLAAGLAALLPAAVRAQVPPEKAESTFAVADGLEMKLWAAEPLLVNPTSIDVDHLGRVWVCEAVNYRCKLRRIPDFRPEGDRIVVLADSQGAGKADKATVFYQGPDLRAPLGVAVAKDPSGPGWKVFVCQSPDILLFEDKDGDGKADGPPKKFLSGFGGFDHDHGVHGILIGPDLKLYFSVGDTGVHGLQGADGKGRKWESNSTDCRAGTVWRCDLDGGNLQQIAHNFRNEYEPCVDSFGTVFVSDNDDDGNQQTRICYVMPGGNYGYHPRGPGQTHWHEEQPGVVPKILRTGFGSPTGMCVYEGTLLPKKYQGQLLHTDAGPRHVRCYHLKPDGAGYEVDREDMVTSTDNWFRPSDVCVAPDGSVMVADWYDPGVGGHGMGDTTRGRIYRLAPKGSKYAVPKVELESKDGLLAALGSPNLAVRYMAMARIDRIRQAHPDDPAGPLTSAEKELLAGLGRAATDTQQSTLRARALWQLWSLSSAPVRQIRGVCSSSILSAMEGFEPQFRLLCYRMCKDPATQKPLPPGKFVSDYNSKDKLQKGLKVSFLTAAERRELLLQMREMDVGKAKDLILDLAKAYDGKDRFYLEAIGIAVGHHDKARHDAILADFDKEFPEWNEKVANLVWELRPPGIVPLLEKRLADPKLPAAQRAQVVDILAASDDREAGASLLKMLQSDAPPEVRARVIDNLKMFLPGKWRDLRGSKELRATAERLLESKTGRAEGLTLVAAAELTPAATCVHTLVLDDREPLAIRRQATQTLGSLPTPTAVSALEAFLYLPEATRVPDLGADAVQALGELARRPGDPAPAALKALQQALLSGSLPAGMKAAVLSALAGCRPGVVWLLDLHARKELPEALKSEAARLLRNTPYQDLRAKALVAFPPPGRLDPKKLPPIAVLAARKGNAERGRQLLAASARNDLQCLKCHSVRGTGGQIGPDLSVIGKKASRENLFESILYPSKAVADQYINWQIETTKGLTLTGLIVEETADAVTLRDGNGKDTKIARKDIDSRTKSAKSLMPEDLLVYMTEDDLVDLVACLFELKTPALAVDSWHIVGPFDNGADDAGLDTVYPPEKGVDLKAAYRGKSGTVSWRTVRPDAQGYVDLAAFFAGHSDNIVSYLYQEIESPQDQEATLLLGADDGCKLWVNDRLVHTSRAHRAAQPGQDTVKVALRKGANRILLKINNGDGAHGFYFTLLAEQELKRVARK
jgi:putative membrane-bound dehydrogenase-like protein